MAMDPLHQRLEGAKALLTPLLGESRMGVPVPLGHGPVDAVLRGGIARGTLHEVFAGDTSAAASGFGACLAQRVRGSRRLFWIRQDYAALEHGELCPLGLAELGIDPAAMLLLRAAADALSCTALGAVVVEIPGNPKVLDLVASRRLLLAAQASGVTAVLLRLGAQAEPSAAETRWQIRAAPSADHDDWGCPRFDVGLVRNRHGETGRWAMEWSCDDGAFRSAHDKADTGAVAAAPSHRPPAPQDRAWRRAG